MEKTCDPREENIKSGGMNNLAEPFVACGTYLAGEPPLSCEKTPPTYLFIWRLDAADATGRRRRITFSNFLQEYIFVKTIETLSRQSEVEKLRSRESARDARGDFTD